MLVQVIYLEYKASDLSKLEAYGVHETHFGWSEQKDTVSGQNTFDQPSLTEIIFLTGQRRSWHTEPPLYNFPDLLQVLAKAECCCRPPVKYGEIETTLALALAANKLLGPLQSILMVSFKLFDYL